MLDLEKLVFEVDTSQLDLADQKLGKLATSVSNLAKPIKEFTRATVDAAKANENVADSSDKVSQKTDRVTSILEKQISTLKILRGQQIEVADGLTSMGDGFTKSQSSLLATLKLAGATAEQMQVLAGTFKEYNAISGINTFDKSASGLAKLKKEISELKRVNELTASGFSLTRDEIISLTRDSLKLEQVFKDEGRTAKELSDALSKLKSEFVQASTERNSLLKQAKDSEDAAKKEAQAIIDLQQTQKKSFDSMVQVHHLKNAQDKREYDSAMAEMRKFYKEQEKLANPGNVGVGVKNQEQPMDAAVISYYRQRTKATKELAAANTYIEKELEKVRFQTEKVNQELTRGASGAILRFQNALKISGKTVEEQTRLLQEYREAQQSMQKATGNRQVDYLSRALGPQITDVFVGLATGQSPMMVLLQQGGQLRDQFALAGVAGAQMGDMLTKAAASMIVSVKEVASAIGGLLVNVLVGTGRKINELVLSLTGLDSVIRAIKGSLVSTFGFGARDLLRFSDTIATVTAVSIGSLIVSLGVAAIAMYKLTKASDDYVRASALQGNALYMNESQLKSYNDSMRELGVTALQSTAILTEMAKAGTFKREDIATIGAIANELEKFAGVSIADTVKQYADVKSKPAESLIEIAKATGVVTVETQTYIRSLLEQGRTTEAVTLIIEQMKNGHSAAIDRMKEDLSPLAKLYIDFKETLKEIGDSFVKIGQSDFMGKIVEQFRFAVDILAFAAGVKDRMSTPVGATGSWAPTPEEMERNKKNAAITEAGAKAREDSLTTEQKLQKEISFYTEKMLNALENSNSVAARGFSEKIKALNSQSDVWNVILGREKNSLAINQMIADQQIKQLSHQREMAQLGQGIFTEEDLINETAKLKLDLMDKQVKLAEKEIEIAKAKRAPQSEINNLVAKVVEIQVQGLGIVQDKENALYKLRTTRAQEELKRWQEFFAEFKKETEDNENRVNQMFDSQQKAGIEAVRNAELQVKFLDAEYKLMGLTQEQRSLAVAKAKERLTYEAAIKKIQEQLEFDPVKQKTLIDLETQKYKLQIEALDKAAKMAKELKLVDDITDAIVTGLTKGAKEGAKKLRDIIAAELRKPIEVAVRASVSGAVGKFLQGDYSGALGSLTGGVSNLLGFGGGSSVYSQFATSGIGEALGLSQTVDAIGGLNTASTALTSAGTAFASAMPYVSAAITAYQLLGDMFGGGGGEKSSTGYGYGISATELSKQPGGAAEQYALGLSRQFAGLVSGLGGTSKLNTGAFWSSDPLGDAMTQLQVAGSVGGSEVYARSNRGLGGHNGIENVGRSDAELQAALNEEAARLLLAALKASDISDEMKSIIGVTDAYTSSLEEVQGAITRATAASSVQERIYQLTATDAEKLTRARQQEKDAMDAALGPMLDRLYALEDEKKILDERKDLEKKLYEVMGDTAKLREIELATLAPANRDLQKNIWAIEDAIAAHEKYTKALEKAQNEYDQAQSKLESARNRVQSIRDTATNNYLQALEKVKSSQEAINAKSQEIANSFKEIAKNLRDYVLDTQKPNETFGRVLKLALGGDAEAMQKLPSLAANAMELAKNSSGTLVEFKRSQQGILNGVSAAADLADRLGVGAASTDPMVKLQNDLLIAQQELAEATRVANSIQAPLVANQNKLIDDYATAMKELADAQLAFATATATLDAIKGNTAATATNTSTAIQRTAELIGSLTGGFDKIDTSLDGLLSAEEIKLALGDKATGAEIVALINAVDANRDGVISRLELLNMTTATVGQAIQMLSSTVLGNFNNIDTSLDGLLTYDELRAGLAASTTKEEINRLIASVDANKDGVISRLELLQSTLVNVGTNIVQGIGASIGLTQAVTFSATDPMRSIFENIGRTNVILIEQFKKYLEITSGSAVSYNAASGSLYVDPLTGFMTPTNRSGGSGGFAGTYALQYDATNYLMNINTLMLQVLGQLQAINLNSYNDSWNTSDMAYTLRMAAFGGYSFLIRGWGPGQSVIVSSNNQSGTPSYFADGGVFTNSIVNRPTAFNMGVMGEAGPEAIMPLRRGIDGSLGVEMHNPMGNQGMDTRGIEARLDRLENTMSNALYQVAKNTQKTSKSLEKWDGDGMPGVRSYNVPA